MDPRITQYVASRSQKLTMFPDRPTNDQAVDMADGWLGHFVSMKCSHWGGTFLGVVVGIDVDTLGQTWLRIAFADEMHAQLERFAKKWLHYIPLAEYESIKKTAYKWLNWNLCCEVQDEPKYLCPIRKEALRLPTTSPMGSDCVFFCVLASLPPAHYEAFCGGRKRDTTMRWHPSWTQCIQKFREVTGTFPGAGNTGQDVERYLRHLKDSSIVENYYFGSKRVTYLDMFSQKDKGMVYMVVGWPPIKWKNNLQNWIKDTLAEVQTDDIVAQHNRLYEVVHVAVNDESALPAKKQRKVTAFKYASKWEGEVKHTVVIRCLGGSIVVYDNQHNHSCRYSTTDGLFPLVTQHLMCIINVYRMDVEFL